MPSSLLRIALALASVGLVAGAGELCARAFYQAPWYEQLGAEQLDSEKVEYRLGPLRIRDQLPSFPKLADQRRIMLIGDSFTFGLGVRDDSAIFPRVLEQRLNDDPPLQGVSRFDILNAGRPGSLTKNWIRLWDELHEAFAPDVLLVVFFLRDGTKLFTNAKFFDRIREEVVERNQKSALYRNSYLARVLRDSLDRLSLAEDYTREFQQAYFGSEEQTAEWRAAQKNLLILRDRARDSGAVFGLAIFPVLAGLDDDYAFAEICELVESFARDRGIPVHNMLPDFLGRRASELWVSPFDQHPNEAGHAIAAESLLPFVGELLQETAR